MTETPQKHVEKAWAIKMDSTGTPFFSNSRDPQEYRCTFASKEDADSRVFEWENWLEDAKPRVVHIEIREL